MNNFVLFPSANQLAILEVVNDKAKLGDHVIDCTFDDTFGCYISNSYPELNDVDLLINISEYNEFTHDYIKGNKETEYMKYGDKFIVKMGNGSDIGGCDVSEAIIVSASAMTFSTDTAYIFVTKNYIGHASMYCGEFMYCTSAFPITDKWAQAIMSRYSLTLSEINSVDRSKLEVLFNTDSNSAAIEFINSYNK